VRAFLIRTRKGGGPCGSCCLTWLHSGCAVRRSQSSWTWKLIVQAGVGRPCCQVAVRYGSPGGAPFLAIRGSIRLRASSRPGLPPSLTTHCKLLRLLQNESASRACSRAANLNLPRVPSSELVHLGGSIPHGPTRRPGGADLTIDVNVVGETEANVWREQETGPPPISLQAYLMGHQRGFYRDCVLPHHKSNAIMPNGRSFRPTACRRGAYLSPLIDLTPAANHLTTNAADPIPRSIPASPRSIKANGSKLRVAGRLPDRRRRKYSFECR